MVTCAQCGAPGSEAYCDELFQRLLALDHSRQPPWGPLHGVAVACFFLQHPDHRLAPADTDGARELVHAYLDGGQRAVDAFVERARRRNSHRGQHRQGGDQRPRPVTAPSILPDAAPRAFATTIVDVSAGGDFPARTYEKLVLSWAEATVAARPRTANRDPGPQQVGD
ncbi:hypothetical protein BDK92_4348 [Micromonospora pisi]|uniref:Uncharacterized protein n=1 Tax=Micromonospora pisi TaxID=589240 RepID=A0A495JNN4_9ACTN|nr:DUF5946 family protein [Micromonospora pisi]RKR89984.1 hypothetical protein BDK92_4348 [Micromonospora pisi]